MTVTGLQTYTSGFCVHARHDHCRGDFRTAHCRCECHTAPEPEPPPLVTVELLEQPSPIHCPTCTCGAPTP